MTKNLCAVFACIRVGGSEDTYQYFVDDLCAILDMAIVDGVGLLLREIFGENEILMIPSAPPGAVANAQIVISSWPKY